MPQCLQESMHCCHLVNSTAVVTSQSDCVFFLHHINARLQYLDHSVSLDKACVPLFHEQLLSFIIMNNWSHFSRYCGTCYRRWACHVDISQVYGRDGILLQNQSFHQSHIILYFVVTVVASNMLTQCI